MKIYSIGEFATKAGITIKTLRHYEKQGLLIPMYNPDNGYRRYCDTDFIKLETILSLKLLGFNLAQVSAFIHNGNSITAVALSEQKFALQKKVTEINKVISLINEISHNNKSGDLEINDLIELIKEMKMEDKDINWYLNQSEEDMKKLGTGYPANKQEENELKLKWDKLLSQATNLKIQYSENHFNSLAKEWIDLIYKTVGNDVRAIDGLLYAYSNMHDWPDNRKLFNPELGAFIGPKLQKFHNENYK